MRRGILFWLFTGTIAFASCGRGQNAGHGVQPNQVNNTTGSASRHSPGPAGTDRSRGTETTSTGAGGAGAVGLPPCTHAGPAVEPPAEFPKDFPLPAGTRITFGEQSQAGGIRVEGFIPAAVKESASFFMKELPAAGYKLRDGEEEEGEAEARFAGKGYTGYLKMRRVADCRSAVTFSVTVFKIR